VANTACFEQKLRKETKEGRNHWLLASLRDAEATRSRDRGSRCASTPGYRLSSLQDEPADWAWPAVLAAAGGGFGSRRSESKSGSPEKGEGKYGMIGTNRGPPSPRPSLKLRRAGRPSPPGEGGRGIWGWLGPTGLAGRGRRRFGRRGWCGTGREL